MGLQPLSLQAQQMWPCPTPRATRPAQGHPSLRQVTVPTPPPGLRRLGLNKNFGIWSFWVSVCIAGRRKGHCLSLPGPSPPGSVLPAQFGAGCGTSRRAPVPAAREHAAPQSAGAWGRHTRTGSCGWEKPGCVLPGSGVRSSAGSGHAARQGSLGSGHVPPVPLKAQVTSHTPRGHSCFCLHAVPAPQPPLSPTSRPGFAGGSATVLPVHSPSPAWSRLCPQVLAPSPCPCTAQPHRPRAAPKNSPAAAQSPALPVPSAAGTRPCLHPAGEPGPAARRDIFELLSPFPRPSPALQ